MVLKKKKEKKCGFLKSAQFPTNSANAKNLESWFRIEAKKIVKDNTATKASLSYHMQEAKKAFTTVRKGKRD